MLFSGLIRVVDKASRRSHIQKLDTYHHGDLRAALLKAAEELISEVGVESLTLRACARRAGVSHGAPAHHFGSLTGLLTELAIEGFQKLGAIMTTAATKEPSQALLSAGLGYIEFAMRAPEQFRIMWRNELLDNGSARLQAAAEVSRQVLRDALRGAYVEVRGRVPADVLLTARFGLAWCCVHGYACLWVEGSRRSHSLSEAKQMLALLRPVLVDPATEEEPLNRAQIRASSLESEND